MRNKTDDLFLHPRDLSSRGGPHSDDDDRHARATLLEKSFISNSGQSVYGAATALVALVWHRSADQSYPLYVHHLVRGYTGAAADDSGGLLSALAADRLAAHWQVGFYPSGGVEAGGTGIDVPGAGGFVVVFLPLSRAGPFQYVVWFRAWPGHSGPDLGLLWGSARAELPDGK